MSDAARHYGMDWLRIGAFGLLILYHVGMAFVPWDWHVKAAPPIDWVAVPMLATNSWRLSLLFVVSGYATRALLGRTPSLSALARDRSARLLIPLAFGMAVILPPQPWIELQAKFGFTTGYLQFWLGDYFDLKAINGVPMPTWNHLWFVAYLWAYSLLLVAALAWLGRRRTGIARLAERWLSGWRMLAIPLAWMLIARVLLFPGVRETNALIDDALGHAVHLPAFLFGVLLGGAPAMLDWAGRHWKATGVLSLVAYAIVAACELRWPGNTPLPDGMVAPFVAARTTQGWAAVLALIGIAERFWKRDHPWRRTLTEAVFPFYIVHQSAIVLGAWWLSASTLPVVARSALLVLGTAIACWLFYALGKRLGPFRFLIGLKRRPASAAARAGGAGVAPASRRARAAPRAVDIRSRR